MNILRKIDFFGAHGNWKICGKDNYSTRLSIFLSLLLLIIFFFKLFKLLYASFVTKSTYNQKITFKTNTLTEIDISGLKYAFCNINGELKTIEWDSHFELSYEYYDLSKKKTIKTIIDDKCSSFKNLNDFDPFYETKLYDYDLCYCLRFDKIKKLNEFANDLFINISLKDKSYDKYMNVLVTYIDNYFDYEKYPLAIRKSVEYLNYKVGGVSVSYNDFFINGLSYDDTSFDFEFFYYRGEDKHSYSFSDKTFSTTDDNVDGSDERRCILHYKSNNKEIFYEISTFSIDLFFASCGGIFQLFHFIFQIIADVNNHSFLDKMIMNKFRKEICRINMNNELININPILVKKYVDLEEFYFSKIFKTENENIKIKSDLKRYTDKKYLKKLLEKFYDDCDFKVFHNLLIEFNMMKKIIFNEKNNKTFDILTKCDLITVMENNNEGLNNININTSLSDDLSIIMERLLSEFTLHILDKHKKH